ncbi:uncharacterized protein PADG_11911 [Paracoccidioides brasiliensis Pb18]|uniref:Uncharacterized protein n=1 Tax=Paracoccidioides brasiliensis (strain Pb18) TaxID=502780 RepID=A0A0A0HV67_PARBD|nr:uncharacterized protein PADG_11911 [Paracoccidioides brasiliensis Pb18]KGM91936.1 hypothetical protein PADG_11911 [Paracoccidioides brasiliensis Pb18]
MDLIQLPNAEPFLQQYHNRYPTRPQPTDKDLGQSQGIPPATETQPGMLPPYQTTLQEQHNLTQKAPSQNCLYTPVQYPTTANRAGEGAADTGAGASAASQSQGQAMLPPAEIAGQAMLPPAEVMGQAMLPPATIPSEVGRLEGGGAE